MELSTKLFKSRYYRWGVVCFLICFLIFNGLVSDVIAGPEGAQVVNGQVSIKQSGSNTAITASDKAIINYSSFDIAQPETVRFIQPGSSASVLNRILSANPTNINGTLLANGRVFFVNPAGVYIGAGARINVNQLVASGLNISNADFINGRYNFVGGNGAVINDGDISAQQVYLIGKQVTNSGNISCPAGYVVMAAGDRVFLGEPGSDIVLDVEGTSLSESANAAAPEVGVLNEGTVDAAGGIIALAAAGDIYSQAISNVGTISASAETGKAGQINLTADGTVTNTGTIEATGSEGGQIAIEGSRVGQFGTIHADGIIGDGGNVNLTASDIVALSSDSLTTANAGLNGDGGDVTVFSPGTALFWPGATIEAKGGTLSGDGGFVEVSGRQNVYIRGWVDASAANGEAGTFLIDPTDITIQDAAGDITDDTDGTFTSTANANTISDDIIEGYLDVGTSVILDTSDDDAGGPYAGLGDITQNADAQINKGAGGAATLTLIAERDIVLNGGIVSTTGTLGVVLTATGDVDLNAAITTNGGTFTSSGVDFDNTNGAITTGGVKVDIQNTGNVTIGAAINAGAGDVDIDGGAGVATSIIDGGGTITMGGGDLLMEASDGIGTLSDKIETVGLTDVAATTQTGGIFINNTGSGNVNVTSVGGTNGLTTTTSGDISVTNTAGNIVLAQAITTAGDGTITLNAGTNGIDTADQTINAGAGTISLTSDTISLGTTANKIVTTGAVTLQPLTAATSIGIGDGAGAAYQLDDAEIAAIQNGTSGITIGRSDGTGGATINAITFNDPVTIQSPSGGSIAVDGQITGAGDASVTLDGSGATTTLSDDIVTAGNPIDISDSVEVGDGLTVLLDTTNSGAVGTGAGVTIQGALDGDTASADGGESLTIRAGSAGAIQLQSTVGATQALDSLTITDSASTTITGTTNVGTFTITDTTGTVAFNGGLTAGTLNTAAQGYNVAINAGGTITTDTDFVNTGGVTLGNEDTDSITFTGGLDTTGVTSGTNIAGTVATTDTQMDLGATTMTANSTLKSGTGAINVASMGGDFDLTLQSDVVGATGAVTFADNVVNNDIITFAQGYAVTLQGTTNVIDSDTSFLNTGLTTIGNGSGDSSTFTGGLDATSAGGVSIAGIVATTNTQMDLGATTMTADSTLKSGSGAINVASLGGAFTLSLQDALAASTGNVAVAGDATITGLTTFGGAADYDVALNGGGTITNDTTFANVGVITLGDDAGDSLTFTGGLDTTSGSSTRIAGTVVTTAQDIDFGSTTLTAGSTLNTGAGAGNITFQSTLNGTQALDLTAGTGDITFNGIVGGGTTLGNVTIISADDVDMNAAFNANNIVITATNTATQNVTAAVDLTLDSTTTVADGATLRAGNNLDFGAANLTGSGALTLIATGGGISGSGTIQANSGVGTQGDLTIRQHDNLNLDSLTFGNQSTTDLTAESYNGGVTIDKTANAADKWQSIAATAQGNVTLKGDGDITANAMSSTAGNIAIESTTGDLILNEGLTADDGGVSLISKAGKIYTPGGANDTLNVPITGSSSGVALPFGSGKAAIVVKSAEDLILGPGAALTANGLYNPATNDDRKSVDFDTSTTGGGDRMDVAIYLGSSRQDPPIGTVAVNSIVWMADNGSMVVDAGEKVTFGGEFNESVFNQTHRLEVVSRKSNNLDEVIRFDRLPFAENPEAIRSWFNETSTGYFAGAYVLRGVRTLLAEVLALSNPVPLVPPRTLEPEFRGEVEGPDTKALIDLLSELGIGVQPYMTEAYADSLSTDLRLYRAAEKLQKLMPVLEDADGTRIAGLKAVVKQFFPTLDLLSEEQMNSFTLVLESHKGDGTDYDLAGQCIFALREYVNILSTEIGWPVETSVEFVMGRYVPRLTENDEIRIAVIQMYLQK